MFALDGTRGLLRAVRVRATRALAALEPRALNRHAQSNAASAAAQAREQLLELVDTDLAVAACLCRPEAERVAR